MAYGSVLPEMRTPLQSSEARLPGWRVEGLRPFSLLNPLTRRMRRAAGAR